MRFVLNLVLFSVVAIGAAALFQSPAHGALAGLIVTGACDTLGWSHDDRQ